MRMQGFFGAAALALYCALAFPGGARADDDSPFLNLDAGACEKLDDKNLQVGPPDEEMISACASLRRGTVLRQRFSGGPGALALSLLGFALVYAALGAPMRGVAGLFGFAVGRSASTLWLETVIGLILRAAIGVAFLAVLSLPFAAAGGCVLILMLLILFVRASRVATSEGTGNDHPIAPPQLRLSVVLADLINDACAGAPGILALAILSRRDPWLLGLGIAVAVAASAPAAIVARRRLRRDPTGNLVATAALGAIFGAAAVADPDLAASLGDATLPSALTALAFAAVVLGASWLGRERLQSGERSA